MTWPTTKQAIEAIQARQQDCRRIKLACLQAYGYTVGPRNPRLNTNYSGRFMVVEPYEESQLPTQDGRNGPWCVVGDDLDRLIDQAFEVLCGMVL